MKENTHLFWAQFERHCLPFESPMWIGYPKKHLPPEGTCPSTSACPHLRSSFPNLESQLLLDCNSYQPKPVWSGIMGIVLRQHLGIQGWGRLHQIIIWRRPPGATTIRSEVGGSGRKSYQWWHTVHEILSPGSPCACYATFFGRSWKHFFFLSLIVTPQMILLPHGFYSLFYAF